MRDNPPPKMLPRSLAVAVLAIIGIALWVLNRPAQRTATPQNQSPLPMTGKAITRSPSFAAVHLTPEEAIPALLDELTSDADAIRRDERLDAWLNEISYSEIPDLVAALNQHQISPLISEIKLRLLRKMAGNDPRAAARLASQQMEGPDRQRFLKAVATVWSALNAQDAIAWARELPTDQRGDLLLGIANETLAADPLQALELAREIPSSGARNELIARVASEWASRDLHAVVAWAEKIEDNALREQVISNVATSWADSDPAKAAELAATSLSAGKNQNDAVLGIVQRWVQVRPSEAAHWVSIFPESELRDNAARELVSIWTDRNARDAGQWVSELTAGATKDAALSAYVGKIANAFPEAAADWVAGIPDVDTRNREWERVAVAWLDKNPTDANRWIERSSLPQAVKDRLLRK